MTLEQLFEKHQKEIKDFHAAKEKALTKLEKDREATIAGVGGLKNVPPSTKERLDKDAQKFDKEWNLDTGLRFAELQERHERERQKITLGYADKRRPEKPINQQQEQSNNQSSNWRNSNTANFQQNQNSSVNQGNQRDYPKPANGFTREQPYQQRHDIKDKQSEKAPNQTTDEDKSKDQSQKRGPEWEALRNEHKKIRERGRTVSKILSVDGEPTKANEPIKDKEQVKENEPAENNEPTQTNKLIEDKEPAKSIQVDEREATKQAFREEHKIILERNRNRERGDR